MKKYLSNLLASKWVWPSLLFLLTLIAAYLRFPSLGRDSFWLDESFYWFISSQASVREVISTNGQTGGSPPLYPVLLHFVGLFDNSEFGLRSLSALAGTLSIPAFYLLGRKFLTPAFALFGSALIAFSPRQIFYSQELREYSLSVLITILVFWAYFEANEKKDTRAWLRFGFIAAVAVLLQYGLFIVLLSIGIHFVYVFIRQWKKAEPASWTAPIIAWLIAGIGAGVTWFTAYRFHSMRTEGYRELLSVGYWDGSLLSLYQVVVDNSVQLLKYSWLSDAKSIYLLLFVGGIAFLALRISELRSQRLIVTLLPIAVTIGFGILGLYPYNGSRHVLFLTVPIYLIVAYGLSELWQKSHVFATTALFAVFLFLPSNFSDVAYSGRDENMRDAVAELCDEVGPNDALWVRGSTKYSFEYYWARCSNSTELENVFIDWNTFEVVLTNADTTWMLSSHLNEAERADFEQNLSERSLVEVNGIFSSGSAWLYQLK
jgi:uncharacterized membrane protein